MIGRRLPVVDGKLTMPEQPGDYCGPLMFNERLTVFFLKPNARDEGVPPRARSVQYVTSPPHTFRECDDGSLEIRASISDVTISGTGGSDGWHGFLNCGHSWDFNPK